MVVVSPSTLGLGAAAVTAWALQRRRLGTDRRMVVVDAGSGSTRCVCLGTRRCDGAVRVVGGPERVPRRLGDALLADDVDAWARDVARAVDAIAPKSTTPVRGAATAGAREALRKRGEKDLGKAGRAVEAALAASTRGRPTAFAVLSGAEEARLEFRAVNAALPGVGVLAGGGKSLQVASSLEDAASLDLDSFAGHERVLKLDGVWVGAFDRLAQRARQETVIEGYAFESRGMAPTREGRRDDARVGEPEGRRERASRKRANVREGASRSSSSRPARCTSRAGR